MWPYLLLAATAFGAATVLPFTSEVLLVAQLRQGLDPLGLWIAASIGNTLGAVVNWWIGLQILRWRDRPWFPIKDRELERGQRWFRKFGVWSLLMAWLPLGGDALTFAAGIARVRLWLFLLLVGLGKSARFAVLIWGVSVWL